MTFTKILILIMFLVLGALAIYQENNKNHIVSIGDKSDSQIILIAKDGTSPGI